MAVHEYMFNNGVEVLQGQPFDIVDEIWNADGALYGRGYAEFTDTLALGESWSMFIVYSSMNEFFWSWDEGGATMIEFGSWSNQITSQGSYNWGPDACFYLQTQVAGEQERVEFTRSMIQWTRLMISYNPTDGLTYNNGHEIVSATNVFPQQLHYIGNRDSNTGDRLAIAYFMVETDGNLNYEDMLDFHEIPSTGVPLPKQSQMAIMDFTNGQGVSDYDGLSQVTVNGGGWVPNVTHGLGSNAWGGIYANHDDFFLLFTPPEGELGTGLVTINFSDFNTEESYDYLCIGYGDDVDNARCAVFYSAELGKTSVTFEPIFRDGFFLKFFSDKSYTSGGVFIESIEYPRLLQEAPPAIDSINVGGIYDGIQSPISAMVDIGVPDSSVLWEANLNGGGWSTDGFADSASITTSYSGGGVGDAVVFRLTLDNGIGVATDSTGEIIIQSVPSTNVLDFDGSAQAITITPYNPVDAFSVEMHTRWDDNLLTAKQLCMSGDTDNTWIGINESGKLIYSADIISVTVDGNSVISGDFDVQLGYDYRIVVSASASSFVTYFGASDVGENFRGSTRNIKIKNSLGDIVHQYNIDDGFATNPVIADSIGANDGTATGIIAESWRKNVAMGMVVNTSLDPLGKEVVLQLVGDGSQVSIDWGDGNVIAYNSSYDGTGESHGNTISHTYASDGVYVIFINGTFDWVFSPSTNTFNKTISRVLTMGKNTFKRTDGLGMFRDTSNLQTIANEENSFSGDLSDMFLNSGLVDFNTSWNIKQVDNLDSMFSGCGSLTGIAFADASNKATTLASFANGATNLSNLNLVNLVSSNATNLSNMFNGCVVLANSGINGWDTSNVTDMSFMFNGCVGLVNANVDTLVTTSLVNIEGMFDGVADVTHINPSSWSVGNLATADNFISSPLLTLNMDATLANWSAQTLQSGVNISFGGSYFSDLVSYGILTGDPNLWTVDIGSEITLPVLDITHPSSFRQDVSYELFVNIDDVSGNMISMLWEANIDGGGWTSDNFLDPTVFYTTYTVPALPNDGSVEFRVTYENDINVIMTEYTTAIPFAKLEKMLVKLSGKDDGPVSIKRYGTGWDNIEDVWVKENGSYVRYWKR